MNAKVNILLPIGESVGLKKATLAPRLQSLQGKTIGVLSNSWQCMTFVADELRMRLVSDYGAKEVLNVNATDSRAIRKIFICFPLLVSWAQ